MTHEQGATGRKTAQADFVGMLALALIVVAVLSALVVAIAAMTAG